MRLNQVYRKSKITSKTRTLSDVHVNTFNQIKLPVSPERDHDNTIEICEIEGSVREGFE